MKKIKIPKRLTRKRALELCVKSWEWMVENPGAGKTDCPYIPKGIYNYCWACEYTEENICAVDGYSCGGKCIVKWSRGKSCADDGGQYCNWEENPSTANAKKVLSACRKSLAKYLEEHK